jgi:hypothetical protein
MTTLFAIPGSAFIETLQLSFTSFEHMNVSTISAVFPKLQVLNLSHSGVRSLDGDGFTQMPRLRVVDLRGCLVEEISQEMFQRLESLEAVYAQTFKLCCSTVLPP